MNQLSSQKSLTQETTKNAYPINLLTELSGRHISGCLKLDYDSISYFIHLEKGKIAYATNSIEPFERLERYLRRLSHSIPSLKGEVRSSVRLTFEAEIQDLMQQPPDYQAIVWLIEHNYLTNEQATLLVKKMIQEVFETYLLLPKEYQSSFTKQTPSVSDNGLMELSSVIEEAQKCLQTWYQFYPHITSSYQRPYFFSKPGATAEQQKIGKILRGFNFRQLSAILNQDEIAIAKKFFPLINNKTIILRDPQAPFDKLPHWSKELIASAKKTQGQEASSTKTKGEDIDLSDLAAKSSKTKQWKIVCIDDSPTILNEISRFLDRDEFSVVPITEPLKALMKIMRIKPDLILLDVGMPNIDGYKLCSLIRKYSAFKNTPIVMVTGNKGLIDRAKARMAGATDYMTKPFTQSDLLDMVFRYLS